MSLTSALTRIKDVLYSSIVQNDLLDALLGAPATEIDYAEAQIEAWGYGALDLEAGTISVTASSAVLTLVGASPASQLYAVDDDVILVASNEGQSGIYRVTAVNSSTQITVNHTFTTSEAGLYFARSKPGLLRKAWSLALYPGGYETDKVLKETILAEAGETHRFRGSTDGITTELSRMANFPTEVLDNTKPLTTISLSASLFGGPNATVSTPITTTFGEAITLSDSSHGSNGVYYVYNPVSGSTVLGRRALNAQSYYDFAQSFEIQFKENRELSRIYCRLINKSATDSKTVTLGLSYAASFTSAGTTGTGYSITFSGGNVSLTGSVPAGAAWEFWATAADMSSSHEFTLTLATSGTGTDIQAVRIGNSCIYSPRTSGTLNYSSAALWKWGGFMKTHLIGSLDESGVTLYQGRLPGWYLGFSYPGSIENDDYTIVSPDEFVVLEVDHRNYGVYSESDIKTAAQDHLVPVDTEYVIGFV